MQKSPATIAQRGGARVGLTRVVLGAELACHKVDRGLAVAPGPPVLRCGVRAPNTIGRKTLVLPDPSSLGVCSWGYGAVFSCFRLEVAPWI